MTHSLTSDDDYRDLTYADRLHPVTRSGSPNDYRFGRTHGKHVRVHAHKALGRANGFLKNMIEAIANSKMRRMERELELRGIRINRSSGNWVARRPGRASVRED